MSSGSGPPSRLSRAASSGYEAATGKAYRALQMLIDKQCGDKELLHCGLEKVKANDGTVEWVAPESKERFVERGGVLSGTGEAVVIRGPTTGISGAGEGSRG